MTRPTPAPERAGEREEMERALNALYLETPAEVARDVGTKVGLAIRAVEEERDQLREALDWTARRLREALAGTPIRDADEVLAHARALTLTPEPSR